MLRYHLDENVDHTLAIALRWRGHDVTTTPPDVDKRSSDELQLAFTLRDQRVIVSHDADMLRLNANGVVHFGIAYCSCDSKTIGQLVVCLMKLALENEPQDMAGRVIYL